MLCVGLFEGRDSVKGVLDGLLGEGHLVDVELLVHHGAQLLIVHFSAAEHLEGSLLQGLETLATGCRHLLLQVCKLRIALVNLGLDHLRALVHLKDKF